MVDILIRGMKDETVAFIDRKAEEISKKAGKKISRNQYIHMILDKELREDLSIHDEKVEHLATGIYDLSASIKEFMTLILEGEIE